ncbi:MAG: ferric reductase-like transmembrane domain-containing protein [Rhodospirillales bacterium]|nr:ferric reductase-like transmembrane domain-containing protein [Rhodospirillales bacterium]
MTPGRTEALAWTIVGAPFALLVGNLLAGTYDVSPWRIAVQESGLWALRWTTVTLMVSPFVALTGMRAVEPSRRALGLGSALYGFVHLWFWMRQYAFDWPFLFDEIVRVFLLLGLAATLLMTPLAATSNDFSRRRLGMDRWRRLHLLIYPAAAAAWFHYSLSIRLDRRELYVHAACLLVAFGQRLYREFAPRR